MPECHTPSLVAWRVLSRLADDFVMIGEDDAVAATRRLARPVAGDAVRDSQEGAFGLGPTSRVLAINTEGPTDLALFTRDVGRSG